MVLVHDAVIERALNFLCDLDLPVTVFCRKVNIGKSTWYRALAGEVELYDEALERIDKFLVKYGF